MTAKSERVLVIGDKNLSSWSMRAWLAAKACNKPFHEILVRLDRPDTQVHIREWSPSSKVPVLREGDVIVWESLAICEYLAERHPECHLWPQECTSRALARSVSHEMHAGFAALRNEHPMNIRARVSKAPSDSVRKDLARIEQIIITCRERSHRVGAFLFGEWSLADCMYAPVMTRFRTYDMQLGTEVERYMTSVLAHPMVREWCDAAERE